MLKTIFISDKNLLKTRSEKIEILHKTNKPRLIADFTLDHTGGRVEPIKHNDNDWKFLSYTGTNLGYDMICESINSDQED